MEFRRFSSLLFSAAFATLVLSEGFATVKGEETLSFNRDIRPILADKCFACHGFDQKSREADLRLDTFEGARSTRDGGPAIEPGNPSASLVWQRIIATDPDVKMPPPDSHKELSSDDVELIKRWIESGAHYQKHWSFEPIAKPDVPSVPTPGYNPIDAFIAQRLHVEGLSIAPEADKPILIRRVAFALTGLPPTTEELDLYLADNTSNAYEAMVDRYLRSNHYGEEMARHWLDVARYADTHGLHLDNERQMWAYRDWVVQSFNRNQPFDAFTVEQLAGDLLPDPTMEQLIATGFNRCNVTTSEGGSIDDEFHYRYAVERASTMASSWMAITAGCAVCHDHKFDPISAKEFYSLYAFFNASADPAMDGNALLTQPILKLETDETQRSLAEFDARIAESLKQLDVEVARVEYVDPALEHPLPTAVLLETVLLDDHFPTGGNVTSGPGHGTNFVSLDQGEPVFSGQRSLKRTDSGVSQDVWDKAPAPYVVPPEGLIFAYVYLDPANPPQSIMLQFYTTDWLHRAVWGSYDAIAWGAPNTTQRVHMGDLPALGTWVRLEVPADKIGLAPGAQFTGFAVTQFAGTVYWDKVGISGVMDAARDPQRSFLAWWQSVTGKDTPGLPGDLNAIAKGGPIAGVDANNRERLLHHYLLRVCVDTKPQLQGALAATDAVLAERNAFNESIPNTFVYRDSQSPRDSFVMLRGQYNQRGEPVSPDVPAIFPPMVRDPSSARPTRLDLARWLVAPDHPLTSRVAVNRFWQQLFGVGLVKTSGDFGTQGEPPSHPELLDWLASSFQESGWDVKHLMRTMLTSSSFRQSARVNQTLSERDPDNRWLARGPRLRLDAEQIRDNVLFVSGLIDLKLGGKGVKPYQPSNIWEPVGFVGSNTRFYEQDRGSSLYRRSLYTFFKRTAPPPFMVNFDAPNREQSCTRRERSNTPLQALQLLNDVQHIEAARALAERAILRSDTAIHGRVGFMFRTVLARDPAAIELEWLEHQYREHLARYQQNESDAKRLITLGESQPKLDTPLAELASLTLIANTILNMDETLTRN